MQKTRIEVKADIAAYPDTREVAWLAADNWRNKATKLADSDKKAEVDSSNVRLVEFGVKTNTSMADSI